MSKKNIFNYDSVIIRKEGIDTTDLDGDKVMMDIDNGKYYVLNEVANDIWESIVQPKSVKDIVNLLTCKYDVDEKNCLDCTREFLGKLKNEELIIVK